MFLILLLSRDWKQQVAKKILAAVLVHFLALFLLYANLPSQEFLQTYNWFPMMGVALFSAGPLLYFYVVATYEKSFRADQFFFKHFIPALLVALSFLIHRFFFLGETFIKGDHGESIEIDFRVEILIGFLGIASLWYYIIKAHRQLQKYRQLVKEEYASISKHDLHWLSLWIKALLVLLVLDVIVGVAASQFPIVQQYLYLNVLVYVVFVWYIGYQGVFQSSVFLAPHLLDRLESPSNTSIIEATIKKDDATFVKSARPRGGSIYSEGSLNKSKIPLSPILQDEGKLKTIVNNLQDALEKQELYKDDNLSLRHLAKAVNITDKQLSEVLNAYLKTNFYEYINSYRVEAFKQLIESGKGKAFTILALALDCGFSSKSSFNRIFKQQTGMTPSAFRKEFER